ncbi:MAG: prolyl oligopeptidase family serine peptidase [Proteobacteria bacterium]|nr:prolyl oligopeptidase family serine peptidase [Pseudomonadota bacterium]
MRRLGLGLALALVAGAALAGEAGDAGWMEGQPNARFAAWLGAEDVATRAMLATLPERRAWQALLRPLVRGSVSYRAHTLVGGRVLALRAREGDEAQLVVREADGRERVLLSPDPAFPAITAFAVAPDGRTVAVNLRRKDSELTRIVRVDVASGRLRPGHLDDVWGEFAATWRPDSGALGYVQLAPPAVRDATDFWLGQRARLHRTGTDPARDPVLLAAGLNPQLPLAPEEAPAVLWPGQGHALALIGGARPELRLCLAPAARLEPAAQTPWRCIVEWADGVTQAQAVGDALYLLSVKDAPGGRLLRLPLHARTTLAESHEVLAAMPEAVITDFAVARDGVYVQRSQAGVSQVLRLPAAAGEPVLGVPLPGDGEQVRLAADPRAAGVLLSVEGWTTPPQTWRYRPDASPMLADLEMGTRGLPAFDAVRTQRLWVRSADGTAVPMTVLRRADAGTSDAPVTAIVEGYAAYGASLAPQFDPYVLAFAEAGQVYALCHARGGGELGDAWRRAGQGAHKARGVEDYLACASALRDQGLAQRVVARGVSMGAVLVGGALVRAPEVFDGAILEAGLLNPSRLAAAPNGANQYAEVGDVRTPGGLAQARAMDPVLAVQDGRRYPPTLLLVGLADNRVAPWHSGKFAERLRSAHPANRAWLRTQPGGGHLATAERLRAEAWADQFAFAQGVGNGLAARTR